MSFITLGIIFSALLGVVFGSFTSMASYRIPRDESMIKNRSHCPTCKHSLGAKDLFPLLSWLFTKGKCRYCHAFIGVSYILHEITLGILFTLVFLVYGYTFFTPIIWSIAVCLVILIAVDLEHYYLPDIIQIPLALLAVTYSFFTYTTPLEPLLGGICYAALGLGLRLLGYAIKKIEALGWGDIKFFGIVGIFLGLNPLKAALFFFCAGIAGIITAIIWKKLEKGPVFPFGPSLAAALLAILLLTSNAYMMHHYLLEILPL